MGENNELIIKQFNLHQLCSNPAIVVIAKRGSGMTWMRSSLLNYLKRSPNRLIPNIENKINMDDEIHNDIIQ